MKSPFKFLDSYKKEDREIFFGRDREIEELYQRVFESKMMLVYGVSGTGKSSLIHCGLANKFQETDWLPLVVRRGGNIINSMAGAIQNAAITTIESQFSTPVQFKKAVRSLYLDYYKPVYIIFDQFEELFIFGDKEERKSFIQIIKSLVESDLQVRLIFVMREEYMAGVTEFERYIPTFFANRVRVEKMAHFNAIEAIIGPCKAAGISLDEGFPEALLESLSPSGADVELTYLQVFLDNIFRLAIGFPPSLGGESKGGSSIAASESDRRLSFTLNMLEKTGNVSDLLGSFLDEQISLLDDPDAGLAVLKSFVSVKGTKKQMTFEEVYQVVRTFGDPMEKHTLSILLQTFINLRIISDKDQNNKYEFRHDSIAAKIFEKITQTEKERIEIGQLLENAYEKWEKRQILLSAADIDYIKPHEDNLYLTKEIFDFLEKSKSVVAKEKLVAANAKSRRRKLAIAVVILLFVISAGFTIWALREKFKADEAGIGQLASILKLNESFEKAIQNQEKRKNEIYMLFEASYKAKPHKLRELWDKADTIRKASRDLSGFIYQMENDMISISENISQDSARKINLSLIRNKSNTDIPRRILFETNSGQPYPNVKELKKKIEEYRTTIFSQIDKKDWEKINFSIETDRRVMNQNGDSASWEDANFKEVILAGAITNLNNLITEINYIEVDVINMIFSWISSESFNFDVIQPIIIPQSTYVISGNYFEADVLLSAFNTKQNIEAYIFEGKSQISESDIENLSGIIPLYSKNGKIQIRIPANHIGENKFAGFVSIKKPDGDFVRYYFSSAFMAGTPSLVIASSRMNVLYRGIENPIIAQIAGVAPENIKLQATNGILKFNNGYTFRPGNEEMSVFTATISTNNKVQSFPPRTFRIKDIPNPVCAIGNYTGGKVSKSDLLSVPELSVKLENFDFDIQFEIIGFSVMILDKEGVKYERTNGSAFSEKQKSLISKLKTGQYLIIKDISVRGSDGKIRELAGMVYEILK